jgi:hypothetical protein
LGNRAWRGVAAGIVLVLVLDEFAMGELDTYPALGDVMGIARLPKSSNLAI